MGAIIPSPNAATDLRYPISNIVSMTTTVRTATILLPGQLVWDTTALAFYTGDGLTAGGVAAPSGFTNAQALAAGWIVPRHKRLEFRLQDAVLGGASFTFGGMIGGNSISEGDGVATSSLKPPVYLQGLLAAYTNLSTSNWTVNGYGVGGSTSAYTAALFSSCSDAGSRYPLRGSLFQSQNLPNSYAYLITMRNDAPTIPIANYAGYLRSIFQKARRLKTDVIFQIDPPSINITTGALLDTASNWLPWYNLAKQVCADENVTLVDVWGAWYNLYQRGFDLRILMNDTVHPNNTGSPIMINLGFQAMTMPSYSSPDVWDKGIDTTDGFDLCSSYAEFNGATLTNISTYGTLIGPTSRELQNGEFPFQVYKITSGQNLFFAAPGPWRAVIVHYLTLPDATNVPTVATQGGAALTAVGNPGTLVGAFCRQYSIRYQSSSPSVYNSSRFVEISANGSNAYVLGVTYVLDDCTECHDVWAAAVEANVTLGGWSSGSDTYYSHSVSTRQSSTVGDTLTITWWGSSMGVRCSNNSSSGKFTVQTDGGAVVTNDLYQPTNLNMTLFTIAQNLSPAWHTTVITVATKNASSSGNTVNIGGWCVTAAQQPQSYLDVWLNAAEVFSLADWWKNAQILTVLSGSPTLPTNFASGAQTITLGGSGAAVVRLTR